MTIGAQDVDELKDDVLGLDDVVKGLVVVVFEQTVASDAGVTKGTVQEHQTQLFR